MKNNGENKELDPEASGIFKRTETEGNAVRDYDCIYLYIGCNYVNPGNHDVLSCFCVIQTGNCREQQDVDEADRGKYGRLPDEHAANIGCSLL